MKRISFLQVVVLAVLTASAVSCGLPMGASGDYYEDAPARGNVYYGDPYYSSPNAIIVQRDPFTGRYYQVNPGRYGGVYARPAYPNNNRRYNNNRNYNNRNYNAGRSKGSYRTNPQTQKPQQTPAQRQQAEQKREQAKESILGKKRN